MTDTSLRYPDPSIRVLDPRFMSLILASASVECLYKGARWSEGPVWFGDGRYLLWSDIPNDRILRWDETSGAVTTFRQSSNNANGHTRRRGFGLRAMSAERAIPAALGCEYSLPLAG